MILELATSVIRPDLQIKTEQEKSNLSGLENRSFVSKALTWYSRRPTYYHP
jgi:hypothetical protein